MKYYAQITLIQNGEPGAVKGQDLDSELEMLLEDAQPEGWEVASVSLSRDAKGSKTINKADEVLRIFDAMVRECGDIDQPARINPQDTKREIFQFWREHVKKILA